MVLNAAVQMLREADELKQNILKFRSGTSMLQERSLWTKQQQLQKIYQKVLVLDLDYALEKKVEQDLWNIGFKQQIEALQAITKDRKNPLRSDAQAMLSWVLQAAAGFYLCLLHQICTTFKLDLPFRRRASLLGWVEGWGAAGAAGANVTGGGARLPPPAAARYICQHCLVHLGDLARYRQQLRVAHTFYRHALVVSVHSGQPYNQLALVAWRRGRRLAALYWHVRSLLVRAPFPPAPANLARTLHAAASGGLSQPLSSFNMPVLGDSPTPEARASPPLAPPARLDAHAYVTELIRAMHMIHSVEQLNTASGIVDTLSASLPALVTDSFECMTLVKMSCVLIWLVHSATEGLALGGGALSEPEARAAALSHALAAAAALALAMPAAAPDAPDAPHAHHKPPRRTLPALKVWLQWGVYNPRALRAAAWSVRTATWPALAATLNQLAAEPAPAPPAHALERLPLPEDEELHGFLPLEKALEPLCFNKHACENIGGRPHTPRDLQPPMEHAASVLEPEQMHRLRAQRVVQLGRRLAEQRPDLIAHTEVDGVSQFTAAGGAEQLAAALAARAAAPAPPACPHGDSDDEPPPPPPPVIISEADFREKVREKRVGILKPQGSLERAREERAHATTQEYPDTDGGEDISKSEDKKETRKPRVNIAMAAIMRKQEETNKQVKFVTPPQTPDSASGNTEEEEDKPITIQPKSMKGLAALPLGRKTGGILALKDKSAGYPHLVNAEPEPPAKPDKDDKKEPKPGQGSQGYQPKRLDPPPSPNWSPTAQPNYDGPRMGMGFSQKNYGIQNAGIAYNPSYPAPGGIRLPVVSPKEIDVRTAALQKQTSRADLFQEGHKFGNYAHQMSGDKKNFLNDLPPRFANQYRYWQQDGDNQFRDDSFKSSSPFDAPQQQQGWMTPQQHENYQRPPWLRPDNQTPNFSQTVNVQPNFYSSHMPPPVANQYQNVSGFGQMPNAGPSKPEGYHAAVGPPLQALVAAQTFSASLNSFGSYAPAVGYDSSMYPQFGKLGYQPLQVKMMDKPPPQPYAGKPLMDMASLAFNSNIMEQQRNLQMNFNDTMGGDLGAMKNPDSSGGEGAANTYSLFSGAAPDAPWGHRQPHQSLWSGPGPSPLERLLEQQKQMKQPPPAPQ